MPKKSEPRKQSKSERFETEDTLDTDAVAGYLEAVAKGLREGNIYLGEEGEGFHAEPAGAVKFVVKAKQGKRRTRVRMTLSFRRNKKDDDAPAPSEGEEATPTTKTEESAATIPDEMSF